MLRNIFHIFLGSTAIVNLVIAVLQDIKGNDQMGFNHFIVSLLLYIVFRIETKEGKW